VGKAAYIRGALVNEAHGSDLICLGRIYCSSMTRGYKRSAARVKRKLIDTTKQEKDLMSAQSKR
jgi:hypothetical protein